MKFSIATEDFSRILDIVSKLGVVRTTVSEYKCVRLEVKEGKLLVDGYGGGPYVKAQIAVEDAEDGLVCVDTDTLKNYVAKCDKAAGITCDVVDNLFKCVSGALKFNLGIAEADSFPLKTGGIENGVSTMLPADLLQTIISRVIFCCSSDSSRPVLQGVKLISNKTAKTLTAVAVDGFRLGRVIAPTPDAIEDFEVVISGATLNIILRYLQDNVAFKADDGNAELKFTSGDVELTVILPLLANQFPDVNKLLDSDAATTNITVNTAELANAVGVAELTSSLEDSRRTPLKIVTKGDILYVESKSKLATSTLELEATRSGKPAAELEADALFLPKYLKDVCKVITTDTMTLIYQGGVSPLRIRPVNDPLDTSYLVLPIRP